MGLFAVRLLSPAKSCTVVPDVPYLRRILTSFVNIYILHAAGLHSFLRA